MFYLGFRNFQSTFVNSSKDMRISVRSSERTEVMFPKLSLSWYTVHTLHRRTLYIISSSQLRSCCFWRSVENDLYRWFVSIDRIILFFCMNFIQVRLIMCISNLQFSFLEIQKNGRECSVVCTLFAEYNKKHNMNLEKSRIQTIFVNLYRRMNMHRVQFKI